MSIINGIFHKILKNPQILQQQKFLIVSPHPDDIEIGCGATVAKLVDMGKQVTFLICTDGRYGKLDYPLDCDALAQTRRNEAIDAAKILGVTDVRFLPLHDGGMYSIEEATKLIALTICDVKPDMVFIPDPNLETESHLDHLKIGRAAYASLVFSPIAQQIADWGGNPADAVSVKGVAMYYTAKPNQYVKITKYMQQRYKALLCHKSQLPTEATDHIMQTYTNFRAIKMGLRCCAKRADGFRVLSTVYTHVLTEWAE